MKNAFLFVVAIALSTMVQSQNFTEPITVDTNLDAVLSFNNTDNSWQYFQFKKSGIRKTWMGLSNGNDFQIYKEGGGNILLSGGNIGIGTDAPGTRLEVVADANDPFISILSGSRNGAVGIKVSNTNTAGTSFLSFGEEKGTSATPAYLESFGSTHATRPHDLDIVTTASGSGGDITLRPSGNINIGSNLTDEATRNLTYGKKLFFLGAHSNSDDLWMARYNVSASPNSSELRVNIGDDPGHHGDKFVVGVSSGGWNPRFIVQGDGKVGIGTSTPDTKLAVKGTIHSEEVKVDLNVPAPDYVFESDYELRTLEETKEYIFENKHLPEIPSASEMEANGIDLGDMNMRLLKKVEELTLYQIELLEKLELQNKRMAELETENARIDELEKKFLELTDAEK